MATSILDMIKGGSSGGNDLQSIFGRMEDSLSPLRKLYEDQYSGQNLIDKQVAYSKKWSRPSGMYNPGYAAEFKVPSFMDFLGQNPEMVELIGANRQQNLLENWMQQTTNMANTPGPFAQRALDFYDQFASGGSQLPGRYQSILDYVTKATQRKGVAGKGGTAEMSGATANILGEAVARTGAQMFNQDLSTLISGIGPGSAVQRQIIASQPDILSGISQTYGKQADILRMMGG